MHDTLKRLHGGQRGTGTTLDRFRLNELVSQLAFAGRRGRVYRRIIVPGRRAAWRCGPGRWMQRRIPRTEAGRAAGPSGRVTGVDPSQAAIAYARRRATRGHDVHRWRRAGPAAAGRLI